ncbi:hypothetical protein PPERSA_06650 [Pseudocohnilembus persalinus]|uniref:Uncharacterized protein n=1 Tax=Pseudocohnilembus persalinus TaxID=266149 RepID=A0A0V0QT05_PSEPJ|nr:hypothetical protein PPERSA_06650 [Pseudocohnilembus persalinus]|eukprot:KRX05016.1 hypothetical protein PPERSA_06650 [Pseudocohnilembus persalinus]
MYGSQNLNNSQKKNNFFGEKPVNSREENQNNQNNGKYFSSQQQNQNNEQQFFDLNNGKENEILNKEFIQKSQEKQNALFQELVRLGQKNENIEKNIAENKESFQKQIMNLEKQQH